MQDKLTNTQRFSADSNKALTSSEAFISLFTTFLTNNFLKNTQI